MYEAEGGRIEFYFNMIQYYGRFESMPAVLQRQLERWSRYGKSALLDGGEIDLEKVHQASRAGRSSGGGWHSDGARLSITTKAPSDGRRRVTSQSVLAIETGGIRSGGGTAVRVRPEDPSVPYDERPLSERIVAHFKLEDGQKGTFAPSVGTQAFDHMAEEFTMKARGREESSDHVHQPPQALEGEGDTAASRAAHSSSRSTGTPRSREPSIPRRPPAALPAGREAGNAGGQD
jgi:hypothetical protein